MTIAGRIAFSSSFGDRTHRAVRIAAAVLVIAALGAIVYGAARMPPGHLAEDADVLFDATRRWLAGGPFYPAWQSVPYTFTAGGQVDPPILYPPPTLLLFVPFSFLPLALWWAVPLGITAAIVVAWRPSPLAWLAIGLCLAFPVSRETIWWGNPVIWIVAAVALGLRFGWGGPFVLLKPSLALFALAGIRRRSWWLGLALLVALSLPFGVGMWRDWLTSTLDATGYGLLYSLPQVPLLLVPVIAWLGTTSPRASPATSRTPATP